MAESAETVKCAIMDAIRATDILVNKVRIIKKGDKIVTVNSRNPYNLKKWNRKKTTSWHHVS